MSRLVWGDPVKSIYETGIDRGVFYPQDGAGVPWNGLTAVSEAPSGSDLSEGHYDGEKYRQQRRGGSFAATLEAYTYPKEFEEYDGFVDGHRQQVRKMFGMSYRTQAPNGVSDDRYLLHLVYNAVVSPSQADYRSLAGASGVTAFQWDLNTIPDILPDGSTSAHVVIDSAIAYPWALAALEDVLYGTTTNNPRLPRILEVLSIFEDASLLRITDHGDGTWTADGASSIINEVSLPFTEIRRNLFRDPRAKTTASTSWGSTAGPPTSLVDPGGKTWNRFTRAATGNVRLADMKVGTSLLASTFYRFVFELRSSIDRTVTINLRPDVTASGVSKSLGTVLLKAGIPLKVDMNTSTLTNSPTANAGITVIHNGTVVGDTLDITNVNIESFNTAKGDLIYGDRVPLDDWTAYSWLGSADASMSIKQRKEEYFEITWPSAIWIDTDLYQVSSL